jgi:hypothetical protein
VVQWSHPDPVGVTESGSGLAAYDPLGNYARLPEPPPTGQPPPPPSGYYGPIWGGAGSLSTNYNNFSMGCRMDGAPANCSSVLRAINSGQAGRATISTAGGADSLFAAGVGGATSSLVSGYVHPRHGIIIPRPGVKLNFPDGGLWRAATFLVPGSQLAGGQTGTKGPQIDEAPLSPNDLSAIKSQLAKWNTPRCKEFLKRLFTAAAPAAGDTAVKTDIVDLFDLVAKQGGFTSATLIDEKGKRIGYSTPRGAVGANNAKVLLSSTSDNYSAATRIHYHSVNALAELTHVAGSKPSDYINGFSDVNLARAAYDVALSLGFKPLKPPTEDPNIDATDDFSYSRYYHGLVTSFCGGPPPQ